MQLAHGSGQAWASGVQVQSWSGSLQVGPAVQTSDWRRGKIKTHKQLWGCIRKAAGFCRGYALGGGGWKWESGWQHADAQLEALAPSMCTVVGVSHRGLGWCLCTCAEAGAGCLCNPGLWQGGRRRSREGLRLLSEIWGENW